MTPAEKASFTVVTINYKSVKVNAVMQNCVKILSMFSLNHVSIITVEPSAKHATKLCYVAIIVRTWRCFIEII